MDWLKLFTLLVAVASISVKADGPKKKIRIHLPQKVKHIHHHKKIYITNHPAPSQYAPAYMPNAEGTVAVPTNVALPAMANIVPINSVDIYDETQSRLPHISPAASQLLPLYHTRGYYGPTPAEIDDDDDVTAESVDYSPPSFPSPSVHTHGHGPPKRVKIIKINEQPRKKIVRKLKPKRVVIRNKPQAALPADGEHPVTTFHEQFYSDIDGSGTIRKIRKPPRVEKIVDGDTEHIHTYSEEHIHKMIVDDGSKLNGVVAVDPFNGISAISNGQPILPFKNGQPLLAIASNPFGGLAAVGSVNSPTHFEYAAYNPREVTHDHIFHDHGEIPADIDVNKDTLRLPPKVSYDSHGLRIGSQNRLKSQSYQKSKKLTKPLSNDFSYYESIYSPNSRPSKVQGGSVAASTYDISEDGHFDEYRTVPEYNYKDKHKKSRNPVPTYYGKSSNDYRTHQSSPPAPFSVSSTVIHEYKPKRFSGTASAPSDLAKYRDPFANFKDSYTNNFEYDTYASASNVYASEDKNDVGYSNQSKKGKKKSVSTQNISFGDQGHVSYVDHLDDDSFTDSIDGDVPTALENVEQFEQLQNSDSVTPPTFTLKESSPEHQYYSLMAAKALNADQITAAEASNDNFQYAERPDTTVYPSVTTTPTPILFNSQSTEKPRTESPKFITDLLTNNKNKEIVQKSPYTNIIQNNSRYILKDIQNSERTRSLKKQEANQDPLVRGKLKYGDKL